MKIYLDMCCLKRPFDDQSAARIYLETLAVESVLQLCRDGQHELITSDALRVENARNPNSRRREFADSLLALAVVNATHSAVVEEEAKKWQAVGVSLLDALHLASSEQAEATVFATCDDVLLRRAARVPSAVRILGLLDLVKEIVP